MTGQNLEEIEQDLQNNLYSDFGFDISNQNTFAVCDLLEYYVGIKIAMAQIQHGLKINNKEAYNSILTSI